MIIFTTCHPFRIQYFSLKYVRVAETPLCLIVWCAQTTSNSTIRWWCGKMAGFLLCRHKNELFSWSLQHKTCWSSKNSPNWLTRIGQGEVRDVRYWISRQNEPSWTDLMHTSSALYILKLDICRLLRLPPTLFIETYHTEPRKCFTPHREQNFLEINCRESTVAGRISGKDGTECEKKSLESHWKAKPFH